MENKYVEAHRFSSRHQEGLEKDTLCDCFHCTKIFSPEQITEWIDDDDTALCPYCGMD